MKPVELKENQFDEVLRKTKTPVVVDFWAPSCAPCRLVEPVIEELAAEYGGRVAFFKYNRDDNPAIAMRYGVMSIPTVIIFKDGKPYSSVTGFNRETPKQLKEHLKSVL